MNNATITFNVRGMQPDMVIMDETHRWDITAGTRYARVESPPPCACGNRRDIHWQHAEEECTWRETA